MNLLELQPIINWLMETSKVNNDTKNFVKKLGLGRKLVQRTIETQNPN